jgi:hypothetical protein
LHEWELPPKSGANGTVEVVTEKSDRLDLLVQGRRVAGTFFLGVIFLPAAFDTEPFAVVVVGGMSPAGGIVPLSATRRVVEILKCVSHCFGIRYI